MTSGDVDEDEAADLKDQVGDDLAFAIATTLGAYTGGSGSTQQQSRQQQRRAFHR